MKKKVFILVMAISTSMLVGCIKQDEYDAIVKEKTKLEGEIVSLSEEKVKTENELEEQVKKYNELQTESEELKAQYSKLEEETNAYKEKMKPYEEMTMAQAEAEKLKAEQEAEKIKEEEAAKKAAEEQAKKEAEEKAKAEAEAEERKGYETGITYDQLARNPDDYVGKKVKFKGKVLQTMEGEYIAALRFAVNSDYDKVLYLTYSPSAVSSRILEDDIITIYGESSGLYSYTSTMGATITIPEVLVTKIDQ